MAAKVTFDPINKIIQVTVAPVNGIINLDVKIDIYSDGKEDWLDNALSKYKFPVRAVGGDALPGNKSLGSTFFLLYGWQIRSYEASHTLNINGNLYTEDGSSPYTPTLGIFNIAIVSSVSSLVDSTVQQLPEIEYASFNGGVTIDVVNGTNGITYPIGTPSSPVNSVANANTIATARGFKTFYIVGNITFGTGDNISNKIIIGESTNKTMITITAAAVTDNCELYDSTVTGVLDNGALIKDCLVYDLSYFNGTIYSSVIGAGTIALDDGAIAYFLNCFSGVAGVSLPIIDCGGSGQSLIMRNYNGGIELRNKSGTEPVSLDINSGKVFLASTVTNGPITIRGIAQLTDDSVGATVISDGLINKYTVATAVWDEPLADHVLIDTMGNKMYQDAYDGMVIINVDTGTPGTTFPHGTAYEPVNNITDALSIAAANGFTKILITSDLTISNVGGAVIPAGFTIASKKWHNLTLQSGIALGGLIFERVWLHGVGQGEYDTLLDCWIGNVTNFAGWMRTVAFSSIQLSPYNAVSLGNSWFEDVMSYNPNETCEIVMNTNTSIQVIRFGDTLILKNMTAGSVAILNLEAATLIIDTSCTGGTLIVRGIGELVNNSSIVPNIEGFVNRDTVADAVWIDSKALTTSKFLGLK